MTGPIKTTLLYVAFWVFVSATVIALISTCQRLARSAPYQVDRKEYEKVLDRLELVEHRLDTLEKLQGEKP